MMQVETGQVYPDYVLNILGGPNPFTPEAQAIRLANRFAPLVKASRLALDDFNKQIGDPLEVKPSYSPEIQQLLMLFNSLHATCAGAGADLEALLADPNPDWAKIIGETEKLVTLTEEILADESWEGLKLEISCHLDKLPKKTAKK